MNIIEFYPYWEASIPEASVRFITHVGFFSKDGSYFARFYCPETCGHNIEPTAVSTLTQLRNNALPFSDILNVIREEKSHFLEMHLYECQISFAKRDIFRKIGQNLSSKYNPTCAIELSASNAVKSTPVFINIDRFCHSLFDYDVDRNFIKICLYTVNTEQEYDSLLSSTSYYFPLSRGRGSRGWFDFKYDDSSNYNLFDWRRDAHAYLNSYGHSLMPAVDLCSGQRKMTKVDF